MKFISALFLFFCFAGCTAKKAIPAEIVANYGTITDSAGRVIPIPEKINNIIVLTNTGYKMVKAIGALNAVKGVSSSNYEGLAAGIENFGSWNKPNIEKIIEVQPDIFFAYRNYISSEDAKKLEEQGVNIVYFDFYLPHTIRGEMLEFGKLFRNESAVYPYIDFIDKYTNLIHERLKDIPEEKRKRVYYESYYDFSSVAEGAGAHELIENAFCKNIIPNSAVSYPKINAEYVIEQDPDIIIKVVSDTYQIMGKTTVDNSAVQNEYKRLKARPLWNTLKSVKNNNFILLHSDMATSPDGYIPGTLVIAKIAYPELFSDIDPIEIYKHIQKEFFRNEDAPGVLVYP
jgi:iron complex transport system substrate-binding protein